jgi:hypothetical protein
MSGTGLEFFAATKSPTPLYAGDQKSLESYYAYPVIIGNQNVRHAFRGVRPRRSCATSVDIPSLARSVQVTSPANLAPQSSDSGLPPDLNQQSRARLNGRPLRSRATAAHRFPHQPFVNFYARPHSRPPAARIPFGFKSQLDETARTTRFPRHSAAENSSWFPSALSPPGSKPRFSPPAS